MDSSWQILLPMAAAAATALVVRTVYVLCLYEERLLACVYVTKSVHVTWYMYSVSCWGSISGNAVWALTSESTCTLYIFDVLLGLLYLCGCPLPLQKLQLGRSRTRLGR